MMLECFHVIWSFRGRAWTKKIGRFVRKKPQEENCYTTKRMLLQASNAVKQSQEA